MQIKEVLLKTSRDDLELNLNIYEKEKYKAVVLICHGMCEHQERYRDFALFLRDNGYLVVSYDMRGHGKSKGSEYGYFSNKNKLVLVDDLKEIILYLKENYQSKIYLFAHSMGSIVARNFLMENSKLVDKVILSGAPNYQRLAKLGIKVASVVGMFKGKLYKSKLLTNLSVGAFNKQIKNPKSPNDWISYDEDNIRSYNNDKLCGFTFTASGYETLFYLLSRLHNPKLYKNVNKNLVIDFLWGEDDYASGMVKGRADSLKTLKKVGFLAVRGKTYEHMRHEILNEKDKQVVYDEVLSLFDSSMNYCPKCGNLLMKKYIPGEGDVDYCHRCDKHYYLYYNVAVSMIVKHQDKYLLIKQYNKNRYILVAGYINKGEDAISAAIREVKEETNLNVVRANILNSSYFNKTNTLMINVLVEVDSLDFELNAEVDSANWFTLDEAKKNIAANSLAEEFFLKYADGK